MRARTASGRTALALLAGAVVFCACAGASRWREPVPPAARFDAARIAADVAWLADDAREGRGIDTPGLATTASHLEASFRAAGLLGAGASGAFLQPFEMNVGIRIRDAALAIGGAALERGRDFEALYASESDLVDTGILFVGYGITDPESGWDDYAGVDVAGRAVLVLDARPPGGEDAPLGGLHGAGFLSHAYKLMNARRHGARAVLLVPSAANAEDLPVGSRSPSPTLASAGVVALALSRDAADRTLRAALGEGLEAAQAAIDERGPAARALPGARLRAEVRVERERGEVANVLAVLPGADPELAGEAVVVGAHYDHLGRGDFGSLSAARRGEVHNGADDNASGTAGLLALARAFADAPRARRTLVLAAFAAEEAGLVGSAEYVRAPAVPLEHTVAMLNLDMIGRLREDRLSVLGAESSPAFRDLVERAADSDLELSFIPGVNGPSDQTSFASAGVPVIFFHTGIHPEYHTPDDDAERIDAAGEARVLAVVYRVTRALLDAEQRPRFRASPLARPGGEAGYGPYLGTVPAFDGSDVVGVRLQGVNPGSPAERAGLRAGDVIVGFGGASVRSLEEYAALLFVARAGERVEIEVERDGARFTLRAVLGQRR